MILVIIFFLYLISWVYYQKFQFKERDLVNTYPDLAYEANKKWHIWKGINHLGVYIAIWAAYGFWNMVIFGTAFWILFDMLCNIIVLKRHAFYVGKTAQTDLFIRWAADKIKITPEITQFIIKVVILLSSIILKQIL